ERHGVGEFFVEESADIVVGLCGRETARTFKFPEQCAGERAVGVWQRDHHETFARPDMECVFFHSPRTIRSRRDSEFLVAVSEITLVVLESAHPALHSLTHGGEAAGAADDGVA